MWLANSLIKAVEDADVKVFYVSFAATRTWAAERDKGEPLVFSGYYWGLGPRESGPFRSMSAAYRDAYFRVVRHKAPPAVAKRNDIFESQRHSETNQARKARLARTAKKVNGKHVAQTVPPVQTRLPL